MKKYLFILALCTLYSCGSNNNETETAPVRAEESVQFDTPAPQAESSLPLSEPTPVTESSGAQTSQPIQGYNEGYRFGYDMGVMAGQENMEYNPYLPVGPNTSSYSSDYRRGYAQGYSAGYENGQQTTHQGIYAEEDDGYESYEYDEEDY